MDVEITKAEVDDLSAVLSLLAEASLPREGVAEHFRHFMVARVEGKVVGAVGMERYGSSALLRSLVVAPPYRGRRLGGTLTGRLLEEARQQGVQRVSEFFPKFGFKRIIREEADAEVQGSVEFRTACCQSAVCMRLDF